MCGQCFFVRSRLLRVHRHGGRLRLRGGRQWRSLRRRRPHRVRVAAAAAVVAVAADATTYTRRDREEKQNCYACRRRFPPLQNISRGVTNRTRTRHAGRVRPSEAVHGRTCRTFSILFARLAMHVAKSSYGKILRNRFGGDRENDRRNGFGRSGKSERIQTR